LQAPEQHLTGARLAIGAVSVSLAMFMNILDTTIANVSIPSISGDLGMGADQGTWIITAYGVALAISLPASTWLAARLGEIRAFLFSVFFFTCTSLMCGLADSYWMLVLARTLQGAAAGPMIPLSQVLLLKAFPRAKSSQALAIWSMTATLAPVFGPILGGVLIDTLSWPWVFYINIPIGVLSMFGAWWIFHQPHTNGVKAKSVPLDLAGFILLALFAGSMQIVLDTGQEHDWFESASIVAFSVLCVVALFAFVFRELTCSTPLVDLTLFMDRTFLISTITLSVGFGVCFLSLVLVPMWLQLYLGYTATWAGAAMAPVGVVSFMLAPFIGRLLPRIDARLVITVSFVVLAVLSVLRSQLTTGASFFSIAAPQLLLGVVMATLMAPLMGHAMSNLRVARLHAASGLIGFTRIMAGTAAVALGATLWERRAAYHRSYLVEHLTAYDPEMIGTLSSFERAGIRSTEAMTIVEQQLTAQSRMLALNDVWLASAAVALLLAGVLWVANAPRRPEAVRTVSPGHSVG
jgi:DHA2 family multidrug resistance protein